MGPSSRRVVRLIDARIPSRPFMSADVYRDYPPGELEVIEPLWADSRERVATEGRDAGLVPLEHSHWDWRNKVERVEAGYHMLVVVECEQIAQGFMAVLRNPRLSLYSRELVVYVDYLESAPWNLKGSSVQPRFMGVGTVLIAEAIRLSLEIGLNGRVGLHSLPQAEEFYKSRCRMTDFGEDPGYFDLTYFEYNGQQATEWLSSIGEFL
jgi:hypothetical protein